MTNPVVPQKNTATGCWAFVDPATGIEHHLDSRVGAWKYQHRVSKEWHLSPYGAKTDAPTAAPGGPVPPALPDFMLPQSEAASQTQRRSMVVDTKVKKGVSAVRLIAASVAVILAGVLGLYLVGGVSGFVKLVDRSPTQATVDIQLPKLQKKDTPKQELPKREVKVEEQPAPVVNNNLGRDRLIYLRHICTNHGMLVNYIPGSTEETAFVTKMQTMSVEDFDKYVTDICHPKRNRQPDKPIRVQDEDNDEDDQPTVRADLNPHLQPVSFNRNRDRRFAGDRVLDSLGPKGQVKNNVTGLKDRSLRNIPDECKEIVVARGVRGVAVNHSCLRKHGIRR